MNLTISVPNALDYFAMLLDQQDQQAETFLCEGALYLAQIEYPQLSFVRILEEIDQFHEHARLRLSLSAATLTQIFEVINHTIYEHFAFTRYMRTLSHPEDFYLHQTILSRRGSPQTLGVLWLEMAQNLNLDVDPIVLPGHIWIRVLLPAGQIVLDPATGRVLKREALIEHVGPYVPPERSSPEALKDETDDALATFFPVATAREVLAHVLEKLKAQYAAKKQWVYVEGALDRLILLIPHQAAYWKERGLLRLQRGETVGGQADLAQAQCLDPHQTVEWRGSSSVD
jgi:regulator of sirC expression with transglutaminase-like and TPR domain